MEKAYLICAVIGGTLWVCQFILSLLGGDHHDFGGADHADVQGGADHDSGEHGSAGAWLIGLLTFRTITAGVTFFGLGGLAAVYSGYSTWNVLSIAMISGLAALLVVASVLRMLHRLDTEGNVRIEGAVGHVASVYLGIPANKAGRGKVTLKLQNRLVEYEAISAGAELPTGSQVVIAAIVGPDIVEVIPARTSPGSTSGVSASGGTNAA